MAHVRLREAIVPETADTTDAGDFVRAIDLGNELEALAYGTRELAYEPAEELAEYRDPFQPRRLFLAELDGALVGRGIIQSASEDSEAAWITIGVHPDARRRGVGTALADELEGRARAAGRTRALVSFPLAERPGSRLTPPTGFGSIPAEDPGARFLLRRGYRFEQVERASRLDLPVPALADRLASAGSASGPDYAVRTWTGLTPERWREDLALLATRMSTDAPSAGLEEPEDVWTVGRLVAEEERREAGNPRRLLVAAAEHVPTGRVVAFSELSVPRQRTRAVHQYSTLVLREHRGHRLGMLVKLANLAFLEAEAPGHPGVFTFNAEENRPMLDVNEAIGFVPIGYEAAFRKDL